jgi:type I restriction enzyme S subunit
MRTPVPPVGEQQRICEYIEAETGLIDGVIDANIRHIELLRERRTALISAAVTGQVDVREEM